MDKHNFSTSFNETDIPPRQIRSPSLLPPPSNNAPLASPENSSSSDDLISFSWSFPTVCEDTFAQSNVCLPYIDDPSDIIRGDNTLSGIPSLRTEVASLVPDGIQKIIETSPPHRTHSNANECGVPSDSIQEDNTLAGIPSLHTEFASLVPNGTQDIIETSPQHSTHSNASECDDPSDAIQEDNTLSGISSIRTEVASLVPDGTQNIIDNVPQHSECSSYEVTSIPEDTIEVAVRQELEIEEDAPPRRWVWNEFVDQNRKAFVIAVGGTILIFLLALLIYGCIHLYKLITQ